MTADASTGEYEVWSRRANMTVGWRAAGGALTMTNRRLLFGPHRVDEWLGGDSSWSCDLEAITDLSVAPRTFHPLNGGLRRRLLVESATSSAHFVVNDVAQVIEDIDAGRRRAE